MLNEAVTLNGRGLSRRSWWCLIGRIAGAAVDNGGVVSIMRGEGWHFGYWLLGCSSWLALEMGVDIRATSRAHPSLGCNGGVGG